MYPSSNSGLCIQAPTPKYIRAPTLDYVQAPMPDYIRGVIDHLGLKKFEGGYPSLTLKSSPWNEPNESGLYAGPLPSSNDGQRPGVVNYLGLLKD